MPIDLSDPNKNEVAKILFFLEMELGNLPESEQKWRLQEMFEQLRHTLEKSLEETAHMLKV